MPSGASGFVRRYWWAIFAAICVVIVILAANFASSDPDGLEKVAEDKGFIETAKDPGYQWLPDYTVPGVGGTVSSILSGIIGLVMVFAIIYVVGKIVAKRRA